MGARNRRANSDGTVAQVTDRAAAEATIDGVCDLRPILRNTTDESPGLLPTELGLLLRERLDAVAWDRDGWGTDVGQQVINLPSQRFECSLVDRWAREHHNLV